MLQNVIRYGLQFTAQNYAYIQTIVNVMNVLYCTNINCNNKCLQPNWNISIPNLLEIEWKKILLLNSVIFSLIEFYDFRPAWFGPRSSAATL